MFLTNQYILQTLFFYNAIKYLNINIIIIKLKLYNTKNKHRIKIIILITFFLQS